MSASFDFDGRVVLVTGACGALGSAVCAAFDDAGATVHATDVVDIDSDDSLLDPDRVEFHRGDLTDEGDVECVVEAVADSAGRLDHLANVAGTWMGGQPIDETGVDEFETLLNVNLKTAFLASKHALPHLRETEGAIVSVSARASLEGGEGDGPYRASKAGIRLLTETLAEENRGTVRANCVMPSVIDTPANREMMDYSEEWVDPADIAEVFLVLCSDATGPTSGAAIPVYGEA
ncbi:SDR family NAD(P)-dependent oxidoreductase [Halalkalicoccus sp. NIPERK01]|uniref:SDR family NAD(P)-dependent oxidoreductase n=1 Tax=Halalkalicoccus sp. NIPERK01 TaxID=3053469 RepID=UPI00256F3A59|nr:SDR family NAD(P)-dependent oxidoreductase [Halalkalicoccus sp. NIPERK01]MDL5361450.1 SDR family NAD(P)-dependent oxidoreductase [Halalkalicoccus sp. NIPERK01]